MKSAEDLTASEQERKSAAASISTFKHDRDDAMITVRKARDEAAHLTQELSAALAPAQAQASLSSAIPNNVSAQIEALNRRMDAQEQENILLKEANTRLFKQLVETNNSLIDVRSFSGYDEAEAKEINILTRLKDLAGLGLHFNELRGEIDCITSKMKKGPTTSDPKARSADEQFTNTKTLKRVKDVEEDVQDLDLDMKKMKEDIKDIKKADRCTDADISKLWDKLDDTRERLKELLKSNNDAKIANNNAKIANNAKATTNGDKSTSRASDHESTAKMSQLELDVVALKEEIKGFATEKRVQDVHNELRVIQSELPTIESHEMAIMDLVKGFADLKTSVITNDAVERQLKAMESIIDKVDKMSSSTADDVKTMKESLATVENKIDGPYTLTELATEIEIRPHTSIRAEDLQEFRKTTTEQIDDVRAEMRDRFHTTMQDLYKFHDQTSDLSRKVQQFEQHLNQRHGAGPTAGTSPHSTTNSPSLITAQNMQGPWNPQIQQVNTRTTAVAEPTYSGAVMQSRPLPSNTIIRRSSPQSIAPPPDPLWQMVHEVRNKTIGLEQFIAALRHQLGAQVIAVQALEKRYSNIMTDDLAKRLTAQASVFLPQTQQFKNAVLEIKTMKADVVNLKGVIQQQDANLQNLKNSFSELNGDFKAMNASADNSKVLERLDTTDKALQQAINEADRHRTMEVRINDRLQMVEGAHADFAPTLEDHTKDIAALGKAILELGPLKEFINSDSSSAPKSIKQILEVLERFQDKFEEVEVNYAEGTKDIVFLQKNVKELRDEADLGPVDFKSREGVQQGKANRKLPTKRRNHIVLDDEDMMD